MAFVAPGAPRASADGAALPLQPLEQPASEPAADASVQPFVVLAAGFAAGLLVSAQVAVAGTGKDRPVFQVVRPDYMKGVDAAGAATKPGQVDYVTRSRMELSSMQEAEKELAQDESVINKANQDRFQRLHNELVMLQQMAKELPAKGTM